MVAGFQDDLDSEDEADGTASPAIVTAGRDDIEISSDENEDAKERTVDRPVIGTARNVDTSLSSYCDNTTTTPGAENIRNSENTFADKTRNPVTQKTLADSDSSDDEDAAPAITVLPDEDISDDNDDAVSQKPAENEAVTDVKKANLCCDKMFLR